jgi:hypothetical protein
MQCDANEAEEPPGESMCQSIGATKARPPQVSSNVSSKVSSNISSIIYGAMSAEFCCYHISQVSLQPSPSTTPTVVTGDDLSSLSLEGHDAVSVTLNIARSLLVGDCRMVEEAGEYIDGALRGTRSNFCGSAFSSCPEISARHTAGWAVASLMFRVTLSSGAQVSS